MQLIKVLCSVRTDEHDVQFNLPTVGSENVLFDIWWTFPEWIEEYRKYGIFPGVSIDAKSISNWHSIPMIFVTDHTNTGHVRVFEMGFNQAERIDYATWFSREFKKVIIYSPKVFDTYFNYAPITYIRMRFHIHT